MKLLNILLISLFLAASAFGAEYYLDATNGSDSDNGTTEGLAWETVDYAWSQVGAGDVVYMMDGNYGTVTLSATASGVDSWANKVTFTKLAGHDPVIQSMTLSNRSFYIEFNNLKIRPAANGEIAIRGDEADEIRCINLDCQGVWNTDFSDMEEQDSSGFDALSRGLYFTGGTAETPLNGILVDQCTVYEVIGGITMNVSVGDDMVISNNTVHTNTGTQVEMGSLYKGTEKPSIIEGNHIYDFYSFYNGVDMSHNSGIGIRTNNIIVQNNKVHSTGSTSGITLYPQPDNGDGAHDVLIQNNLVYDTFSQYAVRLYDVSDTGRVVFRNNTVIGSHDSATGAYYYGVAMLVNPHGYATTPVNCSGLEIYNNIIVGGLHMDGAETGTSGLANATENYNYLYSLLGTDTTWASSHDNTTVVVNSAGGAYDDTFASGFFVGPNFSAAMHRLELNDEYKLVSGSPAIGYAEPGPLTDLLGNIRGSDPDIGCYEYGAEIRYLLAKVLK